MIQSLERDYLMVPLDRNRREIEDVPGAFFEYRKKMWLVPRRNVSDLIDIIPEALNDAEIVGEVRRQEEFAQKVAEYKIADHVDIDVPGLKLPLDDYQKVDLRLMLFLKRVLLAYQVGLGKTAASLAFALVLKERGVKNVLVLCPSSLKQTTWKDEIEKWTNESYIIVDGSRKQRELLWQTEAFFHVANYELVLFNDLPEMQKQNWGIIILDEATRIKSYKAKMTKIIKENLKSDYALALSGTPLENNIEELHSIVEYLDPLALGSQYSFARILQGIRRNIESEETKKETTRIKEKLALFMIRRLKKDVLPELPPKTYENRYVELSIDQKNHYVSAVSDFTQWLISQGEDIRTNNALKKLTRLKQIADSLELVGKTGRSTKLEELNQILSEIIPTGEKVIIFTQYVKMAELIQNSIKYEPAMLMGKMNAEKRRESIERFKTNPNINVFISTDAGAYGLNLQIASYVIHVDYLWNPAKMIEQREGRAHRRGNTIPVTVINLKAVGTIDEYIETVLYKKLKLAEDIVDGSDEALFRKLKLTKEDLLELVRTDKL
mgnify:CR=1 FL=1